jgi:hypothetical protein
MVEIRIENTYSDGHQSARRAKVTEPASASSKVLEQWWEDVVAPQTGDGHGLDSRLGFCYTVTVLRANTAGLAGQVHEWVG